VSDDLEVGPVDYMVIEFPGSKMTGEGLPILVDLVDQGVIRILDLVFIEKGPDGDVTVMELSDLDDATPGDLALFQGASSGLLDGSDISEAARAVEPGNAAGILVYENRWAGPFVAAMRRSGAELVASGRLPAEDVIAAVEALGSAPSGNPPILRTR
jgi:hypothetical protein